MTLPAPFDLSHAITYNLSLFCLMNMLSTYWNTNLADLCGICR